MKIIYNKYLPFKNYKAIMLFGIIFARKEYGLVDSKTILHEQIHFEQMKECLFIFFYLFYIIEFLIKLLYMKDAYKNISFEKEAYLNHENPDYLKKRKRKM